MHLGGNRHWVPLIKVTLHYLMLKHLEIHHYLIIRTFGNGFIMLPPRNLASSQG